MYKHEINRAYDAFKQMSILIIGDVMIDAYIWGNVSRISPEAPVPIVNISKKEYRLGGAANVALNLKHLGANPIICGVIGDDRESVIFFDLLAEKELSSSCIIKEDNRITTTKTRIIGSRQQLIRVDNELITPIQIRTANLITEKIKRIIETTSIDGIIFEDYDKGLLNEYIITKIIDIAFSKNIIVAVDPKNKNFFSYKNSTIFKPNLKELNEGLKTNLTPSDPEKIHTTIKSFCRQYNIKDMVITLSEHGIFVSDSEQYSVIPAEKRDIADVSGAGDTVIAVLTLFKAFGLSTIDSTRIANLAGGLVCEKSGVVPVDKNQLFSEIIRIFS